MGRPKREDKQLRQSIATNNDMLKFNIEVMELGMSKINKDDPNALDIVQLRCAEYYQICAKYEQKPSWEGLALALGVSRVTLCHWRDGQTKWARRGVTEFIQQQWSFLNAYFVSSMMEGKIDKVVGIFLGKNNFDYKNEDPQPVNINLQVAMSPEQLIEEAKNLQIPQKRLSKRLSEGLSEGSDRKH